MRHALLYASLLLGTALVPAQALETSAKFQAQEQPAMHAPTNRIGAAVPTMKSGEEPALEQSTTITPADEQRQTAAAGASKQEGLFAPTNRVGAAVPDLKTGEEPAQTESRTITPTDQDLRG